MDKKLTFYGTPLSGSLNNDQTDNEGPINRRKARLNQQQTVRDQHGRQRFHGAFTGGFSAGYFNTVDTVEGFRPRQFITHRGSQHDDATCSKFSHKPEDYMDDEDLGEFGIAPKKIRISNQYSGNESKSHRSNHHETIVNSLQPASFSIGERILKHLNEGRNFKSSALDIDLFNNWKATIKNNFHGLGYMPLRANKSSGSGHDSSNPLTATMKEGKKLVISGEAFGFGVLEDDEDLVNTSDAYGYDHLENYNFKGKSSSRSLRKNEDHYGGPCIQGTEQDYGLVPGFVLATDSSTTNIFDNFATNYPTHKIEADWRMPVRLEPYIPPTSASGAFKKLKLHHHGGSFDNKFTFGTSESMRPDVIESMVGLVPYSNIKLKDPTNPDDAKLKVSDSIVATISREKVVWNPCSLLCKRFNVPCPNKSLDHVSQDYQLENHNNLVSADIELNDGRCLASASIELKRSIFDVIFDDPIETLNDLSDVGDQESNEDKPQVVEIRLSDDDDSGEQTSSRSDEDVLIVNAPPKEPEVIVLNSSSSSSLSLDSSRSSKKGETSSYKTDLDIYGPPLPPSSRENCRRSSSRHGPSTRKHKKSKKHKKHKRKLTV